MKIVCSVPSIASRKLKSDLPPPFLSFSPRRKKAQRPVRFRGRAGSRKARRGGAVRFFSLSLRAPSSREKEKEKKNQPSVKSLLLSERCASLFPAFPAVTPSLINSQKDSGACYLIKPRFIWRLLAFGRSEMFKGSFHCLCALVHEVLRRALLRCRLLWYLVHFFSGYFPLHLEEFRWNISSALNIY